MNTDETDKLFENAFKYQPAYFPEGMTIDILKNEHQPSFPWTFRLPFKGQKKNETEPTNHKNGIKELTNVDFFVPTINDDNFTQVFLVQEKINFIKSDKLWLTLTFDDAKQGLVKDFEELKLTINY